MGHLHYGDHSVDALGYHGETLTADADGVLTVPVQGTRTVEVNGYLAAWVPAQPAETSTAVVAAASSITVGETTELAAEVSSQADGATGSVEFLDGTVSLGTAELVDGRAVLTTPADLAVGEHSITAVYSGDERHLGSTSPASVLTVVAAAVPGDPGTTPGGGTAPADGTAPVGGGTSPADGTTPVGGTTPTTGSTPAGGTTGLADSGTDAGTASAASPAGSLAFTGAQTAAFVAAAALLLALGAAALVWSRRRRRAL